jgi:hypothetical protein
MGDGGDMSKYKRYIYQCDCHDFHFMTFTWWPGDKYDADVTVEAFVSIGGCDWDSWRRRGKAVWRILRGRESGSYELVLNRDDAVKLRNNLNEFIEDSQSNVSGV